MAATQFSTGLTGLDRAIRGLLPGDNIVWQVDSIEDYLPFVEPYWRHALETGRKLIYFRFAKHEALLPDGTAAEVHELHPEDGFESFISDIHRVIEKAGREAYYVFDCLSDLAVDWYSDQMLGNFFMLTCPYLYDLETIAYFALLKNYHSFYATSPITETTQLFIDVHRHRGNIYVHPLKVQQRHSPTMYMLHVWKGNEFIPVTESFTIAEIMSTMPRTTLESASPQLDVWSRTFRQAEITVAGIGKGDIAPEKARDYHRRLLRMAISRDERVLSLAERYIDIRDLLDIGKRVIGTGLIGGKSVGMLLARAILKKTSPQWNDLLEVHDSFYIASDVFYTFLVRNGCWWIRQRQRDPETFLEGAERARQRILRGNFPEHLLRQFSDILDYFGQSPVIVRSSSLLEDNFGNAFAGKYESVFCANQGSREKRLEDFLHAVRQVYASTMSEKALKYRAKRGLLDRDEQMALLVQRVSGSLHSSLYYPDAAGVGFSFNPYVWSEYIEPEAGMLRLVFGLGTRAVDRSDDDYTRIVALNAPDRRPEAGAKELRQYAQHRVDVLDLEANQLVSSEFEDVIRKSPKVQLPLIASRDQQVERMARERGMKDVFSWVLTFDELLTRTEFVKDMREMLEILHKAYDYPVDIEFTVNFTEEGQYKINLVQCRPLQVKGGGVIVDPPEHLTPDQMVLRSYGAVIGQSRICPIDRLIYVVPSVYGQMPLNERYTVARIVGQVARSQVNGNNGNIMLLGPGRWGTTTPSLGVPVSFSEIHTVSVICEIVAMRDDLVPDCSLGTHFFSEMVEMDILYLAFFPNQDGNILNESFFMNLPNRLTQVSSEGASFEHAVRVIDLPSELGLILNANTLKQRVVCYLDQAKI